jgi:hypothetical protein
MIKKSLLILILSFLVLSLAGVSHGWEGRMAGMGDPYGLIMDESDFLIHPAGIANGKGINFYGNYRFGYYDVTDWDYKLTLFNPSTGAFINNYSYKTSGDKQKHDGLLGAAFPLGPGRMGLFFEYAGKRGDYDGREVETSGSTTFNRYNLRSDLDDFSARLLYGLPMGRFKVGGEIQLAYRHEERKTSFITDFFGDPSFLKNYPTGGAIPQLNFFPFMFPYDSKYYEGLLKGSFEGAMGPAKITFTLRGGFIFGSDNKYEFMLIAPGISGSSNMEGDVKGWKAGGDLWLRYPLAKDLSLPFLVKIDYQKKTREGDGPGFDIFSGINFDYKNREKIFQVEVGGGIDKELVKGTRIAAGIYYDYLQYENDFLLIASTSGFFEVYDHTNYPDHTEHQVILRLSGEKEFSPSVAMRMGLSFFYGWVKEDLKFIYNNSGPFSYTDKISLDGTHWGIGASLGGTVKFQQFSFEPFIGGGYQKLNLNGDGFDSGTPALLEMDKTRKEWLIGGGLSIKF